MILKKCKKEILIQIFFLKRDLSVNIFYSIAHLKFQTYISVFFSLCHIRYDHQVIFTLAELFCFSFVPCVVFRQGAYVIFISLIKRQWTFFRWFFLYHSLFFCQQLFFHSFLFWFFRVNCPTSETKLNGIKSMSRE